VKNERLRGIYLADEAYQHKSVEQNPVMKQWHDRLGGQHAEHEHWHTHYAGHGSH
jgi:hypothetical protein